MEVFRITLEKWSKSLTGSGYPGRWNSKGKFMVYASSSRALASLENVVHRSGEGLNAKFKTMLIHIPEEVKIMMVDEKVLIPKWHEYKNFTHCQEAGDKWLDECETAVLKVPSAIIRYEHNYLLNPRHPDFVKITISGEEDFDFDPRIKESP